MSQGPLDCLMSEKLNVQSMVRDRSIIPVSFRLVEIHGGGKETSVCLPRLYFGYTCDQG